METNDEVIVNLNTEVSGTEVSGTVETETKYKVNKTLLNDDVNIDDDVDVVKVATPEAEILGNPERLPDETLIEYHERQRKLKKRLKSHKMFVTHHKETRAIRRNKARRFNMRLTKPLKKIRKHWFVGETNVTHVVKQKGNVNAYVKSKILDFKELHDILAEENNIGNGQRKWRNRK